MRSQGYDSSYVGIKGDSPAHSSKLEWVDPLIQMKLLDSTLKQKSNRDQSVERENNHKPEDAVKKSAAPHSTEARQLEKTLAKKISLMESEQILIE